MEKLGGRRGFERENGQQEHSEIAELEKEAARFAYRNPDTVQWYKNFERRLHVVGLNEIFEEYAKKSGVDMSAFNVIPTIKTYLIDQPPDEMHKHSAYHFTENVLVQNGRSIREAIMNDKHGYEILLRNTVHEYTHAVGALTRAAIDNHLEAIRIGFFDVKQDKESQQAFLMFNEGMTEVIARDAACEYVRRFPLERPDGTILTGNQLSQFLSLGEDPTYELYVTFVDRLIQYISDQCALPTETIKNAFIRSYFDGTAFAPETEELFQELFGVNFLDELAVVEKPSDMKRLFKALEGKPLDQQLLYRIRKLLHLG